MVSECIGIEELDKYLVDLFWSIDSMEEIDENIRKKVKSNAHNKEKFILSALLHEDLALTEDVSNVVNFGFDKILCYPRKEDDDDDCLIGYHTLETNGFTFLGILAGAEHEYPVFLIIYYDGANIRGYVPEKGNIFNTYTMEAFGNNDEEDLAWLNDYSDDDYSEKEYFKLNMLKNNEIGFCWSKIKNDIISNIEI